MGFIGVGVALIVLGLVLTFSNVFGFAVGLPLTGIGVALIVIGVILAIAHFVMGAGRTVGRRI